MHALCIRLQRNRRLEAHSLFFRWMSLSLLPLFWIQSQRIGNIWIWHWSRSVTYCWQQFRNRRLEPFAHNGWIQRQICRRSYLMATVTQYLSAKKDRRWACRSSVLENQKPALNSVLLRHRLVLNSLLALLRFHAKHVLNHIEVIRNGRWSPLSPPIYSWQC